MNIETGIFSLIVQVTATKMIILVSFALVIDVQKSNISGSLFYKFLSVGSEFWIESQDFLQNILYTVKSQVVDQSIQFWTLLAKSQST